MRITVYGKGNVGGGLADLWEKAGHEVTRLGHDGGDVSNADAVVLAVPGGAAADAMGKLAGAEGKVFIDATNRFGVMPPVGFTSNAEFVKSRTQGPTAKAFNINFAACYSTLGEARKRPHNIWCGDEGSRAVVEQLSKDAGYEPLYAGNLGNATSQEAMINIFISLRKENGPLVYRMAAPEDL